MARKVNAATVEREAPRTITIYALRDPTSAEIRYVGQTNRPPRRRFNQHINIARKVTVPHVAAWIRGLLDAGLTPDLMILEETSSIDDANSAEVAWIRSFRELGARLTNRAEGGVLSRGWHHTPEQREKWRRERRGPKASRFGQRPSADQIARQSAALKRTWEVRPHPRKGVRHTEATRKKIVEALAKAPPRVMTEQGREAHREASRRMWRDPAWRVRFRELTSGPNHPNYGKPISDERREALRRANLGKKYGPRSPETRAKQSAAAYRRGPLSDAVRAKMRESALRRWAREKRVEA